MLLLMLRLPHLICIRVLELQLRVTLDIQLPILDPQRLIHPPTNQPTTHSQPLHKGAGEAAPGLRILEAQVLRAVPFCLRKDDF